jgi:hypothetical protein
MKFSEWLEAVRLPHVNKIGDEISSDSSLVRGPKAWNQTEQNCYAVASRLALKFGYEPASAESIRSVLDQYRRYWASLHVSWVKASKPKVPRPGIANFIVRVGDEFTVHISFEYRGKEYNYGAADSDGFKVLFRMGLNPLRGE